MGWSKETRISIMLAIDIVFFLVELIAGFMVHSLALMADAFHMLNDIISLAVGLWAVQVSRKATTNKYSYGFVRAEILGAFFNAIFLIALCISIILEAITRFVDPPEVTRPQLILIVGCIGLASNLVGFFVLGGHGHGHSHGDDHDHDHDHAHEHGHGHAHDHGTEDSIAAEEGRSKASFDTRRIQFDSVENGERSEQIDRTTPNRNSMSRGRRASGSKKHSRLTSIDDLSIHPASFRQDIIDHSRSTHNNIESDESSIDEDSVDSSPAGESAVDENSPLIHPPHKEGSRNRSSGHSHSRCSRSLRRRRGSSVHKEHNHNKPADPSKKKKSSHGHDHGDMGMNGLILHVIGDALGNLGVIVTALIIWLTDSPNRFYADPAVSLFITLIILKSAIPLTRATAKVLLQATPDHIDLQDIREDIQNLPGVISCHHVHIWQLSDTKVIASMHVQVSFPVSDEGGERYMKLAKQARSCLHAYGIHSATIQPEFCVDEDCSHLGANEAFDGPTLSKCGPLPEGGAACLLECVDDCVDTGCCNIPSTTASKAGSSRRSSHSTAHASHDHDHDGDHEHHHHQHDHHH